MPIDDDRTSWKERRAFEERLADGGELELADVSRLIADADSGERAKAVLEALEEELRDRFGISIVDCTTDDDDEGEIRLDLIRGAAAPHDSIGE